MGQPAARITDMHVCPMVTPGTPPIPHVGGPIITGLPTVMIGGQPAARVSDLATCVGPPDAIAQGAMTVLIGGLPAARMGDMCVHGGKIVMGWLTVLIGDPAAPPSASLSLALQLLTTGGSGTVSDVALVAQELGKMPSSMLQTMIDQGTRVVVCRGSMTDHRTDLAGVHPRGWPPGSTWDTVPGGFSPDRNEVTVAVIGHDTPEGPHVPRSGEGHGSANLVIHESTHSVDHTPDGDRSASDSDFADALAADSAGLPGYERQSDAAASTEEPYAESAARYYGGDPNDAADHPNLHNYWAGAPLAAEDEGP